jgi:Zn-dependent protease
VPAETGILCARCGSDIAASSLRCSKCGRLIHETEFAAAREQAKLAGRAGDWVSARHFWERAIGLVPPDSDEAAEAQARIQNIDAQFGGRPSPGDTPKPSGVFGKWAARLGPAGVLLWKFKTIALLLLTKGKLLLLGLTKIKTLASMLVAIWFYCVLFGWKFGLGFVLSIYVHEMGHVYWLRRYGIAATAPMFIPGFGAFISLKAYPANVGQDARVGLAGPVWGLGAAVFCWAAGLLTQQPVWFALAHAGALINLFNLIPVWQLDGGRGFRALTRKQRGIVLAVVVVMWVITEETLLLLVGLGVVYKLFKKDWPEEPDNGALIEYAGLVVVLSILYMLAKAGLEGLG